MHTKFTIIYEDAPEGGFADYIAEVPGAISEGETLEDAREMVMSALEDVLDVRRELALSRKAQGVIVESLPISA